MSNDSTAPQAVKLLYLANQNQQRYISILIGCEDRHIWTPLRRETVLLYAEFVYIQNISTKPHFHFVYRTVRVKK